MLILLLPSALYADTRFLYSRRAVRLAHTLALTTYTPQGEGRCVFLCMMHWGRDLVGYSGDTTTEGGGCHSAGSYTQQNCIQGFYAVCSPPHEQSIL